MDDGEGRLVEPADDPADVETIKSDRCVTTDFLATSCAAFKGLLLAAATLAVACWTFNSSAASCCLLATLAASTAAAASCCSRCSFSISAGERRVCIIASTVDYPTSLTFFIDGETAGSYDSSPTATGEPSFDFNVLVFSSDDIEPGVHQLDVQNGGPGVSNSLLLLDYIVYS